MPSILSVGRLLGGSILGGFSPVSLFAASEPGGWYDPSDLTTLFQDAAGTTPVTAVEQPVGLVLDKSRGGIGAVGYYSVYFDGNGDYITTPNVSNLRLGSGDFTVEAWIYPNSVTNTYGRAICGTYEFSGGLDKGWLIDLNPSGYFRLTMYGASGGSFVLTSSTITTANKWSHVAAVRSGTSVKLYLDGAEVASGTSSKNEDFSTGSFRIATSSSSAVSPIVGNSVLSFVGNISNLRVVVGSAVYTAPFTPPRAPLTNVSNTSLLACSSSTIVDRGPNAYALTTFGGTAVSGFTSFGNHLSQSTSTARPVLSARVNLLTYTEQFDNAAWTAIGTKTVSQSGSDWVVTDNSASVFQGIEQTGIAVISGATYKGTLKVKKTTGTPSNYPVYQIGLNNIDNSYSGVIIDTTNGTLVTLTGGYYSAPAATSIEPSGDYWLVSLSVTMSSTATRVQIYPAASANGTTTTATATGSITIREPDLRPANAGVGLPAYQRVTTSTNYDTTGFPLYLKFDGTDDVLVSNAINLTSTNKVTAWAGVRRNTEGTYPMICEFSGNWDGGANNGTFAFGGGDPGSAEWRFGLRGTSNTYYDPATYTPPITNVLSVDYDISGASKSDAIKPRVNGVLEQEGGAGTTAGTGNFGNYALYVGARGSPFGLYFNGNLYSLIVRGAATDAATIASTETWVNQKTLAY